MKTDYSFLDHFTWVICGQTVTILSYRKVSAKSSSEITLIPFLFNKAEVTPIPLTFFTNEITIINHGTNTRWIVLLQDNNAEGKGEYKKAIDYFNESVSYLKLNISLDSFYKFGQIHMTLGICYMQLENYALSMKSFEQAKELFSLKEDEVNQAGVYNNLGILYRKEGDFDTAIQFFKESIFMYNNLNNSNQRNNVEIELAKTYFEKGGLEEARRVCLDVLELASINKYKYEAYICLGDIETENSNFSLAIEYYKNALAEPGA